MLLFPFPFFSEVRVVRCFSRIVRFLSFPFFSEVRVMKCFSRIAAVSLVVAMAFGTSNVALATLISDITNPCFDDQALSNGQDTSMYGGGITGWSQHSDTYGLNWIGAVNPKGSDSPDNAGGFIGASGNGTPQGGNGPDVLCLDGGVGGGNFGVQQTLPDTLKAGTYVFTVAVGATASGLAPLDQYLIGIGTADLSSGYLASFSGTSSVPLGYLTDESVTLNVPNNSPHLSYAIGLTMSGANLSTTGSASEATYFANVRFDYTALPEPGTLAPLGHGLARTAGLRLAQAEVIHNSPTLARQLNCRANMNTHLPGVRGCGWGISRACAAADDAAVAHALLSSFSQQAPSQKSVGSGIMNYHSNGFEP